jgi:hypothetical protein
LRISEANNPIVLDPQEVGCQEPLEVASCPLRFLKDEMQESSVVVFLCTIQVQEKMTGKNDKHKPHVHEEEARGRREENGRSIEERKIEEKKRESTD